MKTRAELVFPLKTGLWNRVPHAKERQSLYEDRNAELVDRVHGLTRLTTRTLTMCLTNVLESTKVTSDMH